MQVERIDYNQFNLDISSNNQNLIHVNDLEGHDPRTCNECQRQNRTCKNWVICGSMCISLVFILMLSYYDVSI
jgi:hypothetical protein